ncbi:chemotaxis protein CheX [Desulfosediminicola flagellatus]|uniref:chemotaxis protein CheX n=1 Tax=Desulfosediminicola flagellatus TaxID=2569541 RepID=UPI0010AC7F89|nr:chemotaxis protein CheX [Desulfosediminicola flagellatus]
MELGDKIIDSAKEIFSTMIMMEIEVIGKDIEKNKIMEDSISGVIGLAGTHKGVLAIHLPNKVAMAITSSFLGMEVTEIGEDVEDAIGELANMLGGNVKTSLSEKGRDIELSMPSTISGHKYNFQPTKEVEKVLINFSCEVGTFAIELQLEN